jgi:signal transduction histidine kinase
MNIAELPAKLESSVIMLVKEWFTNIMRHSAKGKVTAQLFQQAGQLCFEARNPSAQHKFIEGNGIHGIRARVAALGGSVNLSLKDNMILKIAIPFEGEVKE